MKYIKKLPEIEEVVDRYSLNQEEKEKRLCALKDIQNVLKGNDSRKLLVVGPCSADREDAVIEYVMRLRQLQEKVQEKFIIVPRIYTSKPRTNGRGYKGMLHRPHVEEQQDDIVTGVLATRKLHYKIIKNCEMYPADEMLYPEMLSYISDLLVYVAVGARSVENQQHRLTASGLEIPVGMKNPTSGSMEVMLNAIIAAQYPQRLMYNGWEVETDGNPYAHAILRGYTELNGKNRPNYYYENIRELYDIYYKSNLNNSSVIIDCNHANSNKNYDEQGRIAKDVFGTAKKNASLNRFIKGIMVESYLEDGSQMIGEGIFGKSVTDGCLGWEKTKNLILEIAEF